MVNNVIGVVNYVIAARPSLLNFVIADRQTIRGPMPPRTQIPNHHRTSRMMGQRQDRQARQETSRSTSPGPGAETIIKGQAVD